MVSKRNNSCNSNRNTNRNKNTCTSTRSSPRRQIRRIPRRAAVLILVEFWVAAAISVILMMLTSTTMTKTTTRILTSSARSTPLVVSAFSSSMTRTRTRRPRSAGRLQAASETNSAAATTRRTYSHATRQRIQGLEAGTEFQKLAVKLDKPPEELQRILADRLASFSSSSQPPMTEKDEFLDWLLSGIVSKDTSSTTVANNRNRNNNNLQSNTNTILPSSPKRRGSTSSSSNRRSLSTSASAATSVPKPTSRPPEPEQETYQTTERFDALSIHPDSLKAVTDDMGLAQMTEIQAKTYGPAAKGHDILGRARTGTGKTVAFLLPALERLIRDEALTDPTAIGMLIVSPTRELATQIGEQAKQLLRYHHGTSVQVVFGGTKIQSDITKLSSRKGLPTVLVATPGRLIDHLENTKFKMHGTNNVVKFGKHIMAKTNIVVLDETDRLLDMGFRREIEKILNYLPPSTTRQTLLFSATIPPDLKTIMKRNMNPNYVEVDCIQDGDAGTHTNDRIAQSHIIIPKTMDTVSSVVEVVRCAVQNHLHTKIIEGESPFHIKPKIVIFFPTARLVQFYAEIFQKITKGVDVVLPNNKTMKLPSWELHSKKTQGYRNRVSDEFRKAEMGVLFTSDVSARGVDYPNVSQVIQIGMPESGDQYIHRLGRTGRGSAAKGTGWIVLQQWESSFLKELDKIKVDVPPNQDLIAQMMIGTNEDGSGISNESQAIVEEVRQRVRGGDGVLSKTGSAAYQAFLGYYKGQMKRMVRVRGPGDLVTIANDFAADMGFLDPPQLQKSTVSKMGLKGVAGLNIGSSGLGSGSYRGGAHAKSSGRPTSRASTPRGNGGGKGRGGHKSGGDNQGGGRQRNRNYS